MEYLDEEKLNLLLCKEWLAKSDSTKSVSYLMKFYASTVDQYCCIMITDTKHVWGEIITSSRIARRWRECNPGVASPMFLSEDEEDEWRSEALDLLSAAHSLGGIVDMSFETVESRNADLAFELRSAEFKWRWEAYSIGPKVSAEIISKHLIMPLISVTHMAFSSADAVGEQAVADLDKAIDKVGRTARRTVDTHIRTAISRPRVTTSLRRMTAVLNFSSDIPSTMSEATAPGLRLPKTQPLHKPQLSRVASGMHAARGSSPGPSENLASHAHKPTTNDSSATEHSADEEALYAATTTTKGKAREAPTSRPNSPSATQQAAHDSSPSSPPSRPTKKVKQQSSSDSDSDEDTPEARKRRLARMKGSTGPGRGVKQPVKRGGKKF